MEATPRSTSGGRTIFIRGIAPRCGTNYLRDLLLLHPDVDRARTPVWEDFALDDADLLRRYADDLAVRWPAGWGVDTAGVRAELLAALGGAVKHVLVGSGPRTVAAKTPSTVNIDLFPQLFPDDVLVLLVRDGRSVVESLVRSFGWSRERAALEWRRSADRVSAFVAAHGTDSPRRWLLLRYEDVLEAPAEAVDQVAVLAGLRTGTVSGTAAAQLPVRGSSEFGRTTDRVHWKPVERSDSFHPERRWQHWDASTLRRFNWVAGAAMTRLGYELEGPVPSGARLASHLARDLGTHVTVRARSLRPRVARVVLGRRSSR